MNIVTMIPPGTRRAPAASRAPIGSSRWCRTDEKMIRFQCQSSALRNPSIVPNSVRGSWPGSRLSLPALNHVRGDVKDHRLQTHPEQQRGGVSCPAAGIEDRGVWAASSMARLSAARSRSRSASMQ